MTDTRHLAGNGVELVRERALAMRVQGGLERVYHLDRVADVSDFLDGAEAGGREALLVRDAGGGDLEMTLRLPQLPHMEAGGANLDALCQIIEGVSHFVYVVERARTLRETTQLELELQAEVDKWVVLGASIRAFDARCSAALRTQLYEHVVFAHDGEVGERYRVANDVANRFVRRLEREYVERDRYGELRAELRRFFQVGQEEKLRLGRAA
ncbi:MAG: hypothetical protein WBY94_19770 [Polyangiaceae bacterium]